MHGKTVLVIDDDPILLDMAELFLSKAGATVYLAENGLDGLARFYASSPHLVILDLMMPDIDGREVCRQIRRHSEIPIIMLTALNRDDDIIHGLAVGADDYMTKPFNPEVLLARCQAVLRRADLPSVRPNTPTYSDGYLSIELDKRRVLVRGTIVKMTATEFRLLTYLVEHANRVLTLHQILRAVWGEDYQGNSAYVHVYIRRLREKLEADPREPTYLLTEHGIGYRFEKNTPGSV